MHIDIFAVILGMASLTAILGILFAGKILLSANMPWPPKLGMFASVMNGIFGALALLYFVAGYIVPSDSSVYEDLLNMRTAYVITVAVAGPLTILMWRMARHWTPPQ